MDNAEGFDKFPEYDFTFKVLNTYFDMGSMMVRFTPVDTRLPALDYNVPIDALFNPADVKTYLKRYAPNQKWFAQEQILNHGTTLDGLEG